MSWAFANDGFDHYWNLAIGAVPSGNVALTWVGLIYPTNGFCGPMRALKAGSGSWSAHADSSKWYTDNDFSSGFTFSLNNWQMLALTIPAGGAGTTRWHGNFVSGGSYGGWSHANGPTISAGAAPIDTLTFGLSYARMAGNIAAMAVYDSALTDTDVVNLGTSSGNTWMTAGPKAYWQCNSSPASGVVDQTGNGANSTSLTGTAPTLDTGNEPPGWSYYTASSSVTVVDTLAGGYGGVTLESLSVGVTVADALAGGSGGAGATDAITYGVVLPSGLYGALGASQGTEQVTIGLVIPSSLLGGMGDGRVETLTIGTSSVPSALSGGVGGYHFESVTISSGLPPAADVLSVVAVERVSSRVVRLHVKSTTTKTHVISIVRNP